MLKTSSISRVLWVLVAGILICLTGVPVEARYIVVTAKPVTSGSVKCEVNLTSDDDASAGSGSSNTRYGSVKAEYTMYVFPQEDGHLRFPISWAGHESISTTARRVLGNGWEFPVPYGLQYTDGSTYFQVTSTGWNVENFRNTEGDTWVPDRLEGDRTDYRPNVSLTVDNDEIIYRHENKRGGADVLTMDSTSTNVYVPSSLVAASGRETTFEWTQSVFPTTITQSVDGQDRRLEIGSVGKVDIPGLEGIGSCTCESPSIAGDYMGTVTTVVLSVKASGAAWAGIEAASSQHVRRAHFIYTSQYASGTTNATGPLLTSIEIQEPVGTPSGTQAVGWKTVGRYVFRYDSKSQLRLVIEPAFYAKFANSADYTGGGYAWEVLAGIAGDLDYDTAAEYASYSYQYDANGNVTSVVSKSGCKSCGTGSGEPCSDMVVEHSSTTNPSPAGSDDYNEWTTCRVRLFRDSTGEVVKRITKYNNFFEQPIFTMVEEGDDLESNGPDFRTGEYFVYDDDGRQTVHAENSALIWDGGSGIDDYENDGLADLADDYDDILNYSGTTSLYLADATGAVHRRAYGASTITGSNVGDVEGYIQEEKTQAGDGGDVTNHTEYEYQRFTKLNGEIIFVMVERRNYVTDTIYERVTYAYDLIDLADPSGDDAEEVTTTRYVCQVSSPGSEVFYKPDGTVDGSGSGKTLASVVVYDDIGRLVWSMDEAGVIDYYGYVNGRLATRIRDVKTTTVSDEPHEGGGGAWVTDTGMGLHLATDYAYDNLGRLTEVLGPLHKIDTGSGLTSVRSAKWVVRFEAGPTALDARWTLQGYETGGTTNTVVGPIKAEYLCKLDRAMATVLLDAVAFEGTANNLPNVPASALVLEDTTGGGVPETLNWLACTTVSFDGDGQLEWRKVFHQFPTTVPPDLDKWGTYGATTDYMKTSYEYDDFSRISKVTGPEGMQTLTFYRFRSITIGGTAYRLRETRVYPTVDNGPHVLVGPISVTWVDEDGDLIRRWTATNTAALEETNNEPDGTDALVASEYRSRTSYLYYPDGRLKWTRAYHTLTANEGDYGTPAANYYQSEVSAYDVQGTVLRRQDGLGTIMASVYDGVGRAAGKWVGTSDGGEDDADLRTNPGFDDSNLIEIEQLLYDTNGATAGGEVPYLTDRKRLDAALGEVWLTDSFDPYLDVVANIDQDQDGTDDGPFRVSRTTPAEGPWQEQLTDGVVNQISRTKDSGGSNYMLAMTTTIPGPGDRPLASRVYAVNSTGGIVNDSEIDTTYAYDGAGRRSKVFQPSGGFTETIYDGVGRATNVIVWSDAGSAADLDDDEAVEERVYTYDGVGHVTHELLYRCDDNAYESDGGGYLLSDATNGAASQVSYVYRWYDDGHALTTVASYGVWAADPNSNYTEPTQSGDDEENITAYTYDDADRLETVTDNDGAVTKKYYDDLSRTTYVVENYWSNGAYWTTDPSAPASRPVDRCRTTAYTYNAAGRALTVTALDPAADGNTTSDDQTTTYTYGDTGSLMKREDFLLSIEYPDDSTNKVTFTYWYNGQLGFRTDQRGVMILRGYNDVGQLLTEDVGPYGGGDVDLTVDKIVRTYDTSGRLEFVTSKDSSNTVLNDVKYVYDNYGNLIQEFQNHDGAVTGGEPDIEYAYDSSAGNRLVKVTYPNDRVVHFYYGGDNTITDRLSRLASIHEDDGDGTMETDGSDPALAQYAYVGLGTVVRVAHPDAGKAGGAGNDGLTLFYGEEGTYDGLDNMGRVAVQLWQQETDPATPKDHFGYGYDGAGNRLYREVLIVAGGTHSELYHAEDATSDYYDELARLLEWHRGTLGDGGGGTNNAISDDAGHQVFTLDQLGNWEWFDEDLTVGSTNNWELEQTRTHSDANAVSVIGADAGDNWDEPAYDLSGNMVEGPVPGDELNHHNYFYDAKGRLTVVFLDADDDDVYDAGETVEMYEYDGLNRRTARLVYDADNTDWDRTDYYYNAGWQVLSEYFAADLPTSSEEDPDKDDAATDVKYQYVWDIRYIDAPVLRDEDKDDDGVTTVDKTNTDPESNTGDERLYYCNDANMNVTALIDDYDVAVVERYEYSPYGEVTILHGQRDSDGADTSGSAWSARATYTFANAILYAGYRHDSNTGLYHVRHRYLHPTLGRWPTRDPIGYGDGLNLYEYVRSGPVTGTDPFGLQDTGQTFLCCVDNNGRRVLSGEGVEVGNLAILAEVSGAMMDLQDAFIVKDVQDFGSEVFLQRTYTSFTNGTLGETNISQEKTTALAQVREGVIDCFVDEDYYNEYLMDESGAQASYADMVILARGVYSETTTWDIGFTTKLLIAAVVENRRDLPNWPNTYEGVLSQAAQFSGWPSKAKTYGQMAGKAQKMAWATSYLAGVVIDGMAFDPTGGADHFYSPYIDPPGWAAGATPSALPVDYLRNVRYSGQRYHGAAFLFLDLVDDDGRWR